ncbi:MAG: single-stranded-DNA-specific exonuclease RecJ [Flavobacteriales bacterium]|jgi:single-stranded-DNA-specific exonuclease|nr:single-stranded-DNA-specific exonuclease RecJ [Flavobacteriales bacterium]
MLNPRWEITTVENSQQVNDLEQALKIPQIVAKLLVNRGVENFEQSKVFFRPELSQLHDPFLMEEMTVAIARINQALERQEKVLIYGDYDVDGTTSVALVYSYLKQYFQQIGHYQPDRYTEGYGISFQGIEYAKEQGYSLIIALDCGTKAVDKIAKANEYGIDFIIADHHTPGEELPKAVAILNPKKNTCNYPYKELCGCGIGFKLIQALAITNGYDQEEVYGLLDFVAIAIGADIVPITGENRVLAYYGLKEMENNPRVGIQTMLELANKKPPLTISDLVFTIAPRINAAGRIDSARNAVELLLSNSEDDAQTWSDLINNYNDERKELDQSITAEALGILKDKSFSNKKTTVISSPNWHKGVVGIVASRLIEKHYKPTIVLVESDGVATGSARSVKGYDIYNAIDQCARLLERFGGHKYAAGLTVKLEHLETFKKEFEEVVAKTITPEQEQPVIKIDGELNAQDFNLDHGKFPKFYRLIKQMSPFGPQNMRPVFVMRNLMNTGHSKIVGEEHLKTALKQNGTGIIFNGIGFGLGEKLDLLTQQQPVDVVFQIDENNFFGTPELQMMIKDIRPTNL